MQLVMKGALTYAYRSPTIGIWLKLQNTLAGKRDRRGVFKQFLKENNIDTDSIDTQAMTRIKYQIRTHHVEHIADIRDQMAHREIVRLNKVQANIANEYDAANKILLSEKDRLAELKAEYQAVSAQLKKPSLTSLQIAHLQGDSGSLQASVKNQLKAITDLNIKIKSYQDAHKENIKVFDKYLREAHNQYGLLLNSYTKQTGRPLHQIGCTNYDAELRDFGDDSKTYIKELKNGI